MEKEKCEYCGRTEVCKGSYPEGCFLENKLLSKSKHEVSSVKCDICNHKWVAVRLFGLQRLECPNCEHLVNFDNINS